MFPQAGCPEICVSMVKSQFIRQRGRGLVHPPAGDTTIEQSWTRCSFGGRPRRSVTVSLVQKSEEQCPVSAQVAFLWMYELEKCSERCFCHHRASCCDWAQRRNAAAQRDCPKSRLLVQLQFLSIIATDAMWPPTVPSCRLLNSRLKCVTYT